ncbi:MAG: putative membrane protein YfcA [Pseudorhodobacter sp.]|jgi:uncharacterized membrane protein YfcA
MDILMAGMPAPAFMAALAIALFAGFVKGTVGFAMPMLLVSGLSSFLPPEIALAGLILPTLATNLWQALRDGPRAAMATTRRYWRFVTATLVFILISAQFASAIPQPLFLLMIGVPMTLYAVLQLCGYSLAIKLAHRNRAEWALGILSGLYGGVSGIWGPPLLVFLMSVSVPKAEMMRVQGVIFLLGSVMLLVAHLNSGVMSGPNFTFSAALVVPAVLGMAFGLKVGDRLDQNRFRRLTQILLVLSGLNLIRRAFQIW